MNERMSHCTIACQVHGPGSHPIQDSFSYRTEEP